MSIDWSKIFEFKLKELQEIAKTQSISHIKSFSKESLIEQILEKLCLEKQFAKGFLDILNDGYGFLRKTSIGNDIYVSASQIRKFHLKVSDEVLVEVREPVETERNYAAVKILACNSRNLKDTQNRINFDDLKPSYPTEQIKTETKAEKLSNRLLDLVAPIGRGQRGIIVAPPKAGKTMFLIELANAMIENYNDLNVWILLVDERPEEVTDIEENVKGAKVFASTFDEAAKNHIELTEMLLERAKRLVESGQDIVILMDSLTRLARAYNIVVPSSGKLISGGIDPSALYFPKKFFGAARNIQNGGSLTIIATALIETGSKMDDVIYEEFKGTGNMELHLDRNLSELRLYPAIDVIRSGTRKEELLLGSQEREAIWKIRRSLYEYSQDKIGAYRKTLEIVKQTPNNQALIERFSKEGN